MTAADDGEPPDVPKAGPERVRDAIRNRRTVKASLSVIEGGREDSPKPKPRRRGRAKAAAADDPPPDGHPEAPDDDAEGEDESGGGDDEFEGRAPVDGELADVLKHCAELDQNDRDNGRRLIVWFGQNLAYVPGMGWLTWRGTHWERDEGELKARGMAQEIVDKIKLEPFYILTTPAQQKLLETAKAYAEVEKLSRSPAQDAAIGRAAKIRSALSARRSKRKAFAVTSGNAGRTSNMLVQATSLKAIDPEALDADHMAFNLMDGTLHFSRLPDPEQDLDAPDARPRYLGEVAFREHNRADLISKCADVEYDPAATCPRFQAFLDRMQPKPIMQRFLQVFHAYAMLIGGNGAQKLVYHYGLGANGKSAFIETLGRLAGSYRTTVSPDTITGDGQRQGAQASPDIARLFNTRFVVVEELPKGVALREDLIKATSGGGKMAARFLQKDIFEFSPIFVAVLSGNTKPTISGSDDGIWRRLLVVPWEVRIAEDDPTRVEFKELLTVFDVERSGILNWLIEGALLYLKHGLMAYVPPEVQAFTGNYRRERDNISVFADSMIRQVAGEHVQAGVLFRAYTDWCEINSLVAAKQRTFGDRLGELGFKKTTGRVYVYQDIALELEPKYDPPAAPVDRSGDPGWVPPA